MKTLFNPLKQPGKTHRLPALLSLLVILTATGCRLDPKLDNNPVNSLKTADFGGQVTQIDSLGRYSKAEAVLFLKLAAPNSTFETTTGFQLYRITYKTTNYNQQPILVSGLLGVPDTKDIKGVVSWQHGTNPTRSEAPSKPTPSEGLPIAAIFAGNGYVLLAPDYIGLGVSNEVPTYLHTESTVNAVINFLPVGVQAIRHFTNREQSNLYLVGFSQGGGATAGVQRQLEKSPSAGLTLKASAAISGGYNLLEISAPYAIQQNGVGYLGYLANAYSLIYGQPLSSIIQKDYVRIVPKLFDGSQSNDSIQEALPATAQTLYTEAMLTAIQTGQTNWFTTALAQNETYAWKPNAPLRLYYGTKDTDVSPTDAQSAYAYMKKAGGNVELLNRGALDHSETLLNSLPDIQAWFNQVK